MDRRGKPPLNDGFLVSLDRFSKGAGKAAKAEALRDFCPPRIRRQAILCNDTTEKEQVKIDRVCSFERQNTRFPTSPKTEVA